MNKINTKPAIWGLKILSILAFSLLVIPTMVSADTFGYVTAYNNPAPVNETKKANEKPVVDSINPKSSNVGVGTKTITITGNGFVPSSVARVNGSNRPTTFIDDSHLLVQVNGNDTSAYRTNGGFFITVFNGAPGGGYSNAAFFTINNVVAPTTNANINNNDSSSSTTNFNDTNSNNTSNNTSTDTNTTSTENTTNSDTSKSYSSLASNAILGSNSFLPSGLIQWVLFAIIILLIVIVVRKIFGARQNYDNSPMKHA